MRVKFYTRVFLTPIGIKITPHLEYSLLQNKGKVLN